MSIAGCGGPTLVPVEGTITLDGKPLYRFAEDTQKGKATGDNVSDSFGGQNFTWHAEGDSSGDSSSGGSSGGGGAYNY